MSDSIKSFHEDMEHCYDFAIGTMVRKAAGIGGTKGPGIVGRVVGYDSYAAAVIVDYDGDFKEVLKPSWLEVVQIQAPS